MRIARRYRSVVSVLLLLAAAGLGAYSFWRPPQPNQSSEPFFSGLGSYSRKITTTSPTAQRYFDQGLAFLTGFKYEEAQRSFAAAAANDPDCPMAYWGIAMANGPNVNSMVVGPFESKAACESIAKARGLLAKVAPVEAALIQSVGKRFHEPAPRNRQPLDEAYAAAMRAVWKAYPNDADVGALTAEALMDLRPWDLWTHDGHPQPGTDEVLHTLDAVLAANPEHPFALHLLIHAVEASPHPEKADAAADRLRDMTPALEHLLHMPSHIDIRRGRWQQAVAANEKAIAAERNFRQLIPQDIFGGFSIIHDELVLSYAAMMQGQSAKAMQAVHEMLLEIPEPLVRMRPDKFDGYYTMPYELQMRFGQWDALLAAPQPRHTFHVTTAMWHFARGVAFAAKRQVTLAQAEQQAFLGAVQALPPDTTIMSIPARSVLGVADRMLSGEILYRQGKTDEAVAALREAVRREDDLDYIEPPVWVLPVRHALGATLLDAGRGADAEAVYRDDLVRHPENGWSLYGLAHSLRLQRKTAEAVVVSGRLEKAWQHADIKLPSSCFCLPSTR